MENEWVSLFENGIDVQVRATKKYKTTTVYAVIDLPLRKETVTRHALLPSLLLHGTMTRPAPDLLMRAIEDLFGANMHARIGKHGDVQTLEYILQVPDEQIVHEIGLFEQAMQLFAEMIFDPFQEDAGFAKRAFQIEKTLHDQKISNLINDKMSYAAEKCLEIMAEDEPYGIPRLGYAKDLETLDPQTLLQEYLTIVKTKPLHLYIVGDLEIEGVKAVVTRVFGHYKDLLQAASEESVTLQKAKATSQAEVKELVEAMEVNQGKLNLGLRTGINYASDDYPALLVYNGILGGFPHSKLFINVREKASLAYYASSRLEGLKGYLFIYAGIDSEHYVEARKVIELQMKDIANGNITDDELEFTQVGLINQYMQSDDPPLTGAALQMYARYTGRAWTVQALMAAIDRVNKEDVIRVAQQVALDTVYFLKDRGGLVQ